MFPEGVGDVPALADLAKRTWSDAFGDGVSRDDEATELAAGRSEAYFARALETKTILVAEADCVLVGYVQFGVLSPTRGGGALTHGRLVIAATDAKS